jgi:hypothetical protein
VRHVTPYFDERDLARRPAFEVLACTVHHGHDVPPFTLATEPLPPPVPGRAEQLRAAARERTGLTADQRAPRRPAERRSTRTVVPSQSAGQPSATQQVTYDWPTD